MIDSILFRIGRIIYSIDMIVDGTERIIVGLIILRD